jgi:hypothetical protein
MHGIRVLALDVVGETEHSGSLVAFHLRTGSGVERAEVQYLSDGFRVLERDGALCLEVLQRGSGDRYAAP